MTRPRPQAICDQSGFKVDHDRLVKQWDGALVDRAFVDKRRQPQDFVRGVKDNQSLPYTRPEMANVFDSPLLEDTYGELITDTDGNPMSPVTP